MGDHIKVLQLWFISERNGKGRSSVVARVRMSDELHVPWPFSATVIGRESNFEDSSIRALP